MSLFRRRLMIALVVVLLITICTAIPLASLDHDRASNLWDYSDTFASAPHTVTADYSLPGLLHYDARTVSLLPGIPG